MNANLFFTLFAIILGFTFLAVSDQAESLDITKIIQGTLKEANANSIEIVDASNNKETRIAIDPNTVYDNVQKLTDLKEGDKVQAEYQMVHNKKIAVTITKMDVEG